MLFKKSFIYTLRNWGRARGYNLKIKTRFVKNLVDNRINDYIKGNHKSKSNIVFVSYSLSLSLFLAQSVVVVLFLLLICGANAHQVSKWKDNKFKWSNKYISHECVKGEL